VVAEEDASTLLKGNFLRAKEIIEREEMWERVPERAREFSPENLEGLVKFAYFGGFIDMVAVRRLLQVTDRDGIRRLIHKWYDEVREQGCWLC
jgi:hypothetical protein